MNAQYRFLMKPTSDYSPHWGDADLPVFWPNVAQVVVCSAGDWTVRSAAGAQPSALHATQQELTCPICLSPPTAPRITRCGHVYCYACMLHYLIVADDENAARQRHARSPAGRHSKRCPVCWDDVSARDLKPVHWFDAKHMAREHARRAAPGAPAVEQQGRDGLMTLRLVERPHDMLLALPRSPHWSTDGGTSSRVALTNDITPFWFQPDALAFSRFILATPEFLAGSLREDIAAIDEEAQSLRKFCPDELTLEFLRVARQELLDEIERTSQDLDTRLVRRNVQLATEDMKRHDRGTGAAGKHQDAAGTLPAADVAGTPAANVAAATDAGTLAPDAAAGAPAAAGTVPGGGRKPQQPRSGQPSSYFFYQAASGQNIYLHPIDIKVLLSHFGTYANFPDTLHVILQGAEEGTVDENLRRRCKYLSHLPMSTDVIFVEVDWASTCAALAEVQGEIRWQPFEATLKQRATRRREKAQREELAKVRAEKSAKASEMHAQSEAQDDPLAEALAWSAADHSSFRDSALHGAEMYFPLHPGAREEEQNMKGVPAPPPSNAARNSDAPVRTTVWGTPAAASSSHADASSASGADAKRIDDAWMVLEQAHAQDAHPTDEKHKSGEQPPARSQKRNKPKLILTGGGRMMN